MFRQDRPGARKNSKKVAGTFPGKVPATFLELKYR